ncbi:MAG: response regulator [bacterium]
MSVSSLRGKLKRLGSLTAAALRRAFRKWRMGDDADRPRRQVQPTGRSKPNGEPPARWRGFAILKDWFENLRGQDDLVSLAEKCLETTLEATGADAGALYLYDRELAEVYLGKDRNMPPETIEATRRQKVIPSNPQIAAKAAYSRKPVVIGSFENCPSDILSEPTNRMYADHFASVVAMPLEAGGKLSGVVVAASSSKNHFTAERLENLTIICGGMGFAIEALQYREETLISNEILEDLNTQLGLLARSFEEEKGKLESVIRSISDGIIMIDDTERIILMNDAAATLYHINKEEFLGEKMDKLLESLPVRGKLNHGEEHKISDRIYIREVELFNRYLRVYFIPARGRGGNVIGRINVIRDVTGDKEIAAMKDRFVSTVSHELRTPLTSIKGYTDVLLAGRAGELSEKQRKYLGVIREQSHLLINLINDLLDISKMEAGEIRMRREDVNIGALIDKVTGELAFVAEGKGVSLTNDIPEDLPHFVGDPDRMAQVLTNLIGNAIKFTPEGGKVTVSAERVPGGVLCKVKDTGIGIPPEDLDRVFDRFYRIDNPIAREVGGTGLGLSIAKDIVEAHNGFIWADSELGKGSMFCFAIPTDETFNRDKIAEDLADRPPLAEEPQIKGRRSKILVVEDDASTLDLIKIFLEERGYEVAGAQRSLEAIRKARLECPDLITLDILMPDISGFDVLSILKNDPRTKHIPVIVLSIVKDPEKGFALGAVDYIAKPIDEDRLLGSIRAILGERNREEREKVLIVDDEPNVVELIAKYLERNFDFEILKAYGGSEALDIARGITPDLVILDLLMPDVNGYDVIRGLREGEKTKGVPIIILSVQQYEESGLTGSSDISEYLTKPYDASSLAEAIARTLPHKPKDKQSSGVSQNLRRNQ